MKKPFSQAQRLRGGTLVGFVVGLLVGLGAALSVAIYVTRVPVPFVDRGVSRKPAQDVEEAERNKGWNPNAALAGKEAPAPVPATLPTTLPAPGTASVTPPAPAGATATLAAQAPTNAAAAPAAAPRPAPGTDPLGDLAQARLGTTAPAQAPAKAAAAASPAAVAPAPTAAAAAAPGADPFTYFVQAGAFRTPEDAETQRAKLAILGIDAQISEREQSGRTVFRVRVGPFEQKVQADGTREQLEVNGVEAALVRVQR
jgi:cell division protein FtsN